MPSINQFNLAGHADCPRVIAHRGASGVCPENTLVAIQEAIAGGADVVEVDVRLTEDEKVCLLHDDSVNRTTNGLGLVQKMTLEQLRELDAGHRFSMDHGLSYPFRGLGIKVPLLQEVLDAFPDIRLQVELKGNQLLLAEKVIGILRSSGARDRVQLVARDHRVAAGIRAFEPDAMVGHGAVDAVKFLICACVGKDFCPSLHAGWIDVPLQAYKYGLLGRRAVAMAVKHGLGVRVFTVNDARVVEKLAALGVAGIFTDHPKLVSEIFNARGRAGN